MLDDLNQKNYNKGKKCMYIHVQCVIRAMSSCKLYFGSDKTLGRQQTPNC